MIIFILTIILIAIALYIKCHPESVQPRNSIGQYARASKSHKPFTTYNDIRVSSGMNRGY